jgi:DNA-binding protein H-NS
MKPEDDDYPSEKLAALRTVRKLVEFWQIRPQELRGPMPPAPPPPPAATATIRYRHPVSGQTWNGQDEHPQWLRDALLKEGYTVDELKRAVGFSGATNGATNGASAAADASASEEHHGDPESGA